jgi:hypothetical protein
MLLAMVRLPSIKGIFCATHVIDGVVAEHGAIAWS